MTPPGEGMLRGLLLVGGLLSTGLGVWLIRFVVRGYQAERNAGRPGELSLLLAVTASGAGRIGLGTWMLAELIWGPGRMWWLVASGLLIILGPTATQGILRLSRRRAGQR